MIPMVAFKRDKTFTHNLNENKLQLEAFLI